jgi:ABC-2 type transport system ATP-binding protein
MQPFSICDFKPILNRLFMELFIRNLTKQYSNGVLALDDVNLQIGKGMFGLLGPNGAGKSSLMRTIATLQQPDAGEIFLGDIDVLKQPHELRLVLGYLPQEFGVYPRTSALDLLNHLAILKGITHAGTRKDLVLHLLSKVNLYEHRKKAVSSYSGGMRQRFGIAQCLIGDPQLIIVDEPTAGLDPGERNRFYNILSEIGEQTIVILSTHIVQDVHELCNHMAIMNLGRVLFSGTTADALDLVKGKVYEKWVDKDSLESYKAQYPVISHKRVGGQPQIHVFSDGMPGDGFVQTPENLEDVYFAQLNNLI